jgi:hypothetical protein
MEADVDAALRSLELGEKDFKDILSFVHSGASEATHGLQPRFRCGGRGEKVRATFAPVGTGVRRIRADQSQPLTGSFGLSKAVERAGIEPATSGLQSRRSPS